MKISRKELLDLLGVKSETLKKIEQKGTLTKRLSDKGYIFYSKEKFGRSYLYEVEINSESKNTLNNITCVIFNTKDDNKFSDYFLYRLANTEQPLTKELISKKCALGRKTISNWDKQMVEHDLLSKDGFFYVAIDYGEDGNKSYRLTGNEEYMSYIQNSKFARKKKDIARNYKENKIDYDTMQMLMDSVTIRAKEVESKFVYRINKFQLNQNSNLCREIYNLIISTYSNKNILDYHLSLI